MNLKVTNEADTHSTTAPELKAVMFYGILTEYNH